MSAPRDVERLIDRLVDGELPEPDRRALLALLDDEPGGDGWRRCALAFLEAQSWREALRPSASAARASVPAAGGAGAVPEGSQRRPPLRAPLAAAAALLFAFALGWLVRGVPEPEEDGSRFAPLARSEPVPTTPPAPPAAAEPVSDPPSSDPDTDSDPGTPESVERAWRRRGFEVERRQRLLAVEADGGRRVTLPVDEVRLRYVGDRTY
jgi:hypothetical protein